MQTPLWTLAAVQWLHVAFAIAWVGTAVAFELLVTPVASRLSLPARRAFGQLLARRIGTFFPVVGAGTVLLGVLRGTLLGPIKSLPTLGTPYGLTWLFALAVTIGLAVIGGVVVGPTFERMHADDELWVPGPDGGPSPGLERIAGRLDVLGRVELACFGLVLACMVLMSIGL